jgi:hypothetical protein
MAAMIGLVALATARNKPPPNARASVPQRQSVAVGAEKLGGGVDLKDRFSRGP